MYIFRVDKGPFVEEFYQCVTYGAFPAEWHSKERGRVKKILDDDEA